MFGSAILDVAIGVVLIYTLLSLACTAGTELFASATRWRAKNLANGIRNLLDTQGPISERTTELKAVIDDGKSTLAQQFYDHPLIQSLYRKGRLPSYIPSKMFALVLMDIVLPRQANRAVTIEAMRSAVAESPVGENLKRLLTVLIDDAGSALEAGQKLREAGLVDVEMFDVASRQVRQNIEVWFNDSMERVAGWYKQKTQAATFVIAIVLTVGLNADTIAIAKRLSYDSALRQSLVAQAEKLAEQPVAYVVVPDGGTGGQSAGQRPEDPQAETAMALAQLEGRISVLQQTGVPLGWPSEAPSNRDALWMLTKFLGLLLTAAAASLGAPFWFDVLNKIMTIRSSGKAPEERPKSPKEVPRPVEPGQSPGAAGSKEVRAQLPP